jgi:TPR repeat protein
MLLTAAFVLAASTAYAVSGDQTTFNKGVAAYDSGQYEDAFKIFHDLAENDDLAAMRNVALMYRRGQGVPRNPQKALDWFERAAEAGLGTAQADLGVMLLDGEAGDPEPHEAIMWLTYASDAGHAGAQFRLGQLYEKGEYVSQNLELAKRLYAEAAARGHSEAGARLAVLSGLAPEASPAPAATVAPVDKIDSKQVQTAKKFVTPRKPPALRPALAPPPEATQPSEPLAEGTMHKTFAGPRFKSTP